MSQPETVCPSFDATVCLASPAGAAQAGAGGGSREADERALVEAARREEAARRGAQRASLRALPRHTISRLADTVLSSPEGGPSFGQKLAQLLRCGGGR